MFKFSEYNTESVGSVARKSLKLGNMNKKYNDNIITEDMQQLMSARSIPTKDIESQNRLMLSHNSSQGKTKNNLMFFN